MQRSRIMSAAGSTLNPLVIKRKVILAITVVIVTWIKNLLHMELCSF
ncbi:MAG: hypothetical protein JRF41_14695 [Deltaproteobacteria bacterium]|nr:hypothetical protein [Deltaproteobacteria bacterium]